eukprot:TRINITY_DN18442_c0_g1_i1.p1 TRINITY_DN18442_c0_g1~~TRINITY_DN18442_c0_g1_i1.p1  ORF type:complete len:110 (-),score=30.34 TRINITY_DN18442_c0_g1_i1:22-351(-)
MYNIGEEHKKREEQQLRHEVTMFCFDFCINNFRTRKLDSIEQACLQHCAEKFMSYHIRAARIYEQQMLLKEDKQRQLLSNVLGGVGGLGGAGAVGGLAGAGAAAGTGGR